jgi:hypothetical protein
MNVDPMNHNTIQIDQISPKQHHHIDNEQDEKSKEINKMKKSPMNPTLLYVSFFSFSIIIQIFH